MTFKELKEELLKSIEMCEKENEATIDKLVIEIYKILVSVDGSKRTIVRTTKVEIS